MMKSPQKAFSTDLWEPRTITPSLKEITNIHDNCIFDWSSRNKVTRMFQIFYFQTTTVVLEEHGDRAPVRVGRHAGKLFALQRRGWEGRIMQETKLIVVSRVKSEEMVLILEADTEGDCSENVTSDAETLPIELGHESAESGKRFFRKPHIWLVLVLIASHIVTLLTIENKTAYERIDGGEALRFPSTKRGRKVTAPYDQ